MERDDPAPTSTFCHPALSLDWLWKVREGLGVKVTCRSNLQTAKSVACVAFHSFKDIIDAFKYMCYLYQPPQKKEKVIKESHQPLLMCYHQNRASSTLLHTLLPVKSSQVPKCTVLVANMHLQTSILLLKSKASSVLLGTCAVCLSHSSGLRLLFSSIIN